METTILIENLIENDKAIYDTETKKIVTLSPSDVFLTLGENHIVIKLICAFNLMDEIKKIIEKGYDNNNNEFVGFSNKALIQYGFMKDDSLEDFTVITVPDLFSGYNSAMAERDLNFVHVKFDFPSDLIKSLMRFYLFYTGKNKRGFVFTSKEIEVVKKLSLGFVKTNLDDFSEDELDFLLTSGNTSAIVISSIANYLDIAITSSENQELLFIVNLENKEVVIECYIKAVSEDPKYIYLFKLPLSLFDYKEDLDKEKIDKFRSLFKSWM